MQSANILLKSTPPRDGHSQEQRIQPGIVETFAAGAVTPQAVESFYAQTLPQLGWTASGAREFRREGEKLTLEITPGADATTVRFTLAPQ